MNTYDVSNLQESSYFTGELLLDKSFILLDSVLPVTKQLIQLLLNWEFDKVQSMGVPSAKAPDPNMPKQSEPMEIKMTERKSLYQQMISEIGRPEDANESNKLTIVQAVYNEYLNYINAVYTTFVTHKKLEYEEIFAQVKDLCEFVKENRRYVLRVQPSQSAMNKVFLVSHAMRSTVIALTIAIQLKMPDEKLVELGVACLLHEIGMIKLPPQVYFTNKPLTPTEKNSIFTHTVISYNILKDYNFPLNICLAALEHHEKENGTGYPRKLSGQQISLFAKIISIACSFEAITSPRHYKEASSSPAAMVELLKNSGRQYDETVIKALLYALSLFPIGAYVCLSDGRIAQVVDVNPENPKNPIVQIFGKLDEKGEPIILPTSDAGIKISRALLRKELDNIINT